MNPCGAANVLSRQEARAIFENAARVLAEVGVVCENEKLLKVLAERGATVDFQAERVWFPERFLDALLAESSDDYDLVEGMEGSCLFPYGERKEYSHGLEVTAGTYPQFFLDLDGRIVPHTSRTVAFVTELADRLENIDRLGVMGIPSDVPAALGPLYMRLLAWKHAAHKLSSCGEVRDPHLLPYILEMGNIIASARRVPLSRYTYAEVELISPLKFTRVEADIFVRFWNEGLLAGIGCMHSAGGSAPATLAATVSLSLAESLFINALYRCCYGWHKLWFQINSSILDMKNGMFPFGRPERGLMILAMGQLAREHRAGLWSSAVYPDAKTPGIEAGLQASFNTIPAIIAGTLGIECFGLLSGAEMNSAVQLVIDNEYAAGLKRFARGFEVNEDTLAFDVISEIGPGGFFGGTDHTVAHFRREHWQPNLFSREGLNAWLAGDRKTDLDKAREICEDIKQHPQPPAIDEHTEQALRSVIERAKNNLLV